VSPGGMATLECAVANVGADKVHMIWIRQSPGQKPEGVLSFLTDLKIYRAPGIPERFEPSRDAANKTFLLTIREVQAGDDSIYFCFAYYGSAGVQTWGEGTRVRVLRSDLPQPRMQLFPPAQEELATGAATLTCLVSGFFPGYVEVQWKREGQRQAQGVSTGPVALGPDQTYAVSSHLRVSAGEWHAGTRYSCLARHESLRSPLERSISAQACRPAQPHKEPLLPEPGQAPGPAWVWVLSPPRETQLNEAKAEISDNIVTQTHSVPDLSFAFYTSDGVQTWGEGTRVRVLSEYGAGCSLSRVHPGGWDTGPAGTCETARMGTPAVSTGSDLPQPHMQLFPPAQEELATGAATLTFLVSGFFPGYVEVQWEREGQRQAQGVSTGPVALGPDKTYTVSSHLTVPVGEWHVGTNYSCLVLHESLRSPLESQACLPVWPCGE
uniref:Ig-like domain-containing protein n=1 Tax=Pelodiscus sinensis TaxID=13735 RepID=K7G9B2_PELSI